jgi:hypothetical protein
MAFGSKILLVFPLFLRISFFQGYHFFTLQALSKHMYYAQKFGIDMSKMSVPKSTAPGNKTVESMFAGIASHSHNSQQAPLYLLQPDNVFPSLNDGGEGITPPLTAYEYAHSLFTDQIYDWMLGQILASSSRNAFESMVYGIPYQSSQYQVPSHDLENMGVTVMRNANDSYLLFKYGPHGGWHGHYDKGTIVLFKVGVCAHFF